MENFENILAKNFPNKYFNNKTNGTRCLKKAAMENAQ
jgi:hypothetical protein